MSHHQASNLETGIFAERAATWVGWALLASLSTVVLFASLDKQHHSTLETYEEPTGVGDQALFKMPGPSAKPVAAVSFRGQPLYPVNFKTGGKDSRMIRFGQDDSGKYRIYVNRESGQAPAPEAAKSAEGDYYLKTGPDAYLNVRPDRGAK